MNDDNRKYPIPEKFRVSLDITDEQAFALLQKCDKEQAELGARINSPLMRNTPQERARSKALATIRSLSQAQKFEKLTADQTEMLAEAWAATGRYDLAHDITKKHKVLYKKYWKAVFLPDDQWCQHPAQHKYIKENIFSVKHGAEMPLLCCNICRTLNVADTPDELAAQAKARSAHQSKTKGMSMDDIIAYHKNNVKKG